jgi:multidrug transporter EmrE-like cation transporter
VSTTGSWIAKSLAISVVIALVTGAGFYMFFRVHQELDVQPAYAFKLGAIAFVLSAIVAMIYFRNRAGAR